MKDVGCLVLPGDLVEKLVLKMYGIDKDWLLTAWYEEGARLGAFLKMSALKPESGECNRGVSSSSTGSKNRILRVVSLPEDQSGFVGASYQIRALGAGNSLESTSCADQFIRGILSSYSLKILDSRIVRGIIDIKAVEDR